MPKCARYVVGGLLLTAMAAAAQMPPPMQPGLMLALPASLSMSPADYATHQDFEAAVFEAVSGGDGVLTLDEVKAAMPPAGQPPMGPMIMMPLPPSFVPPPPGPDPEAKLAAMFAAVAGDDLQMTLEEFQAALPDPEMWPPAGPGGGNPGGGNSGGGQPGGAQGGPPMGGNLFIGVQDAVDPASFTDHTAFETALFSAAAGPDGVLTLDEVLAMQPQPGSQPAMGIGIPMPEGFVAPLPQDGPEAFVGAMFAAVAGDDGVMTLEEFLTALPDPQEGPGGPGGPGGGTGSGGGGPLGGSFDCPECTTELFTAEMLPQDVNVPCGSQQGNLVFRTVCNEPGFNTQAISMPPNRTAGCFGIEAITPNTVIICIYREDDASTRLFDSDRDGLDHIGDLQLTVDGVYRVELDMARSAPGARATVRFVDHPTE